MRPRLSRTLCGINPLCHIDQLQSIKDEWIEVYNESQLRSTLMSFDFIYLWYKCFASPDQVRIYRAFDGERTIGFLPLRLSRKKGVRILKGVPNTLYAHSAHLCRKGNEAAFPGLILDALLKDRHGWGIINLNYSCSFSEIPDLFSDSLLNNQGVHWNKIIKPNYSVVLRKNFDDYFRKDLTAKSRRNIKMSTNRIKRAGEYSFKYFQGEDAIRLWNEFVRIEDSGWKGNINSSIKRTKPAVKKLYYGLAKILSDRKVLHMYFLELNGKFIAGGFGYFEGDIYHYAKAGYDEKYKALSPSNLLFIYLVENLITNFPEIKRINMFPWNYGYKHRVINEKSNYLETIIFSKTMPGNVMRIVYSLKEKIKHILKRLKLKKENNAEVPRIWKSN